MKQLVDLDYSVSLEGFLKSHGLDFKLDFIDHFEPSQLQIEYFFVPDNPNKNDFRISPDEFFELISPEEWIITAFSWRRYIPRNSSIIENTDGSSCSNFWNNINDIWVQLLKDIIIKYPKNYKISVYEKLKLKKIEVNFD